MPIPSCVEVRAVEGLDTTLTGEVAMVAEPRTEELRGRLPWISEEQFGDPDSEDGIGPWVGPEAGTLFGAEGASDGGWADAGDDEDVNVPLVALSKVRLGVVVVLASSELSLLGAAVDMLFRSRNEQGGGIASTEIKGRCCPMSRISCVGGLSRCFCRKVLLKGN